MDVLLVLPLTLSFFMTALSDITGSRCTVECPAGYHVAGKCGNNTYMCKPCEADTYTAIPNQLFKCWRCSVCEMHEIQIKPCVPDNNVVCACKDGFYAGNPDDAILDCKRCPCEECARTQLQRMCEECRRCSNDTNCRKQCKLPPTTTSATLSVHLTTNTSVHELTTAGNLGLHKAVNQVFWMVFAAVMVSLLLLLWLLLLCVEKPKLPIRCPCWAECRDKDKDKELPRTELKSIEQFSHQSGSPCVMIYTSVETPIQRLSPASPGRPDSVAPLLPSTEHKDEQAEGWPAVVLYAIIREVPLRRWKEFLRLLSLSEQQMDRVELEAGLNSIERQYQMLRLWSQGSSASLDDVFCALHRMELSGCAQLLQESLEKMHWTPKVGAMDVAMGNSVERLCKDKNVTCQSNLENNTHSQLA